MFRKNIKKISALFLSLSLTMFILAGCGETKDASSSESRKTEKIENENKESNKNKNNIDKTNDEKAGENRASNDDISGDESQNKGDKDTKTPSETSLTPSSLISSKLDGSFSINGKEVKVPVKFKDLKEIKGLEFGEVKKEMLPKSYEDIEGILNSGEENQAKTISVLVNLLNHGKENKATDDCNIYKLKFIASDDYEKDSKDKENKENITFGLTPEDLVERIGDANDESENEDGTIIYTYIRENKDGGEDKYTFKFKKNKNESKPTLSEMEMDISNLAERKASR